MWDDLADEEIDQIAALQKQQWSFPTRNSNSAQNCSASPAQNNGPRNLNIACCNCKKKGHMQRECHSRCHDGAPMVDANGMKYEYKVNNVAEKEDIGNNVQFEDAHGGAVTNLSLYHHLNW